MAAECCCHVGSLPLHRVHTAKQIPESGSCTHHIHSAPVDPHAASPSYSASIHHATLVPASPLDPIQDLDLLLPTPDLPTAVRAALGSGTSAPLFTAELARNAKVYWVEQTEAQTNERMQRSTGLSTIRGDVLVLYSNATSASVRGVTTAESAPAVVPFSRLWFESPTTSTRPPTTSATPSSAANPAERCTIDDLPISLLQDIFGRLTFCHLSTCAAVCTLWRSAICQDELLLLSLPIQRRIFKTPPTMPALPPRQLPPGRVGAGGGKGGRVGAHPPPRLPIVLRRAAEAGNLIAMVLVGEEMQGRGEGARAIDWFRKAARKGHQGSQYAVGSAYYKGEGEVARDGEEALAWLMRAAKNPNADNRLTAAAALLLGYMYLDGEGTHRMDNSEAVKWLRMAAQLGCLEAQQTVGWLWNTGQY